MGLRETNALRTKRIIVESAMDLFGTNGYDETTMEEIARRADVGSSTLYRYFATKEAVFIGFLQDPGLTADALRARPVAEPPEVSLGHALMAFLEAWVDDPALDLKFRELAQANARPRARLMEWFAEMHDALVIALEERVDGPAARERAGAMAWTTIYVLQRALDRPQSEESRAPTEVAREVMDALAQNPPRTPRLSNA